MRLGQQPPVEPVPLMVGDRVHLTHGFWKWWTVQAVTPNFVACVQQVPFRPKGTLCYTVLDWRNGVRGPCNLVGQGWGDGTYTEAECAEMLADFEKVIAPEQYPGGPPLYELEISHRNRVPLEICEVSREGLGKMLSGS